MALKLLKSESQNSRCYKRLRRIIEILLSLVLIFFASGCGNNASVRENALLATDSAASDAETSSGQDLIDIRQCSCGDDIHSAPAAVTDTSQFSYIYTCIVDHDGQDYYLCSSRVITDVKIFEVFYDAIAQKYYFLEDTYFYHDSIMPTEAVEIKFNLNSAAPNLALSYKIDGTEYVKAFVNVAAQGELLLTDIDPELTREIIGQTYRNHHTALALRDARIAAAYAEAYSLAEELFSRYCFVEWDHYCVVNQDSCYRFYVVSAGKVTGAIAVDSRLEQLYVDYDYNSSFYAVTVAEDGLYEVDESEEWKAQ